MTADQTVKVLVADDEPISLNLACTTLSADPRIVVAAKCADGRSVLQSLSQARIDVAVLDIRMPRADGLQLSRVLSQELDRPEIVFVSAFSEHALEAFDLGVVDYVTKPYEPERLRRAVLRAAIRRRERSGSVSRPIEPIRRLLVKSLNAEHLVEFRDIERVSADEKDVHVYSAGRMYRYGSGISSIEKLLPCPPFVRIHRSHIVSLDHVAALHQGASGTGTVTLRSGQKAPISRRYRRRLSALFFSRR